MLRLDWGWSPSVGWRGTACFVCCKIHCGAAAVLVGGVYSCRVTPSADDLKPPPPDGCTVHVDLYSE